MFLILVYNLNLSIDSRGFEYEIFKFNLVLFGVSAVLMISILFHFFYRIKKVKSMAQAIIDGEQISPRDFLETRKYGGREKYINRYNFPGVYVTINYTKDYFYIGYGQRVFDRIFYLFTGRGNVDVYLDYISGDNIVFMAFQYRRDQFNSLNEYKYYISSLFEENFNKYGQETKRSTDKPVVEDKRDLVDIKSYGSSVTGRIDNIDQPRGGYLSISKFDEVPIKDEWELKDNENLHASIVGMAVDYLTRASLGAKALDTFEVSLKGASNLGLLDDALNLVENIDGLNDESIIAACQLCSFDVAFRQSVSNYTRSFHDNIPNEETIHNIKIMVSRTVKYLEDSGPVLMNGFDLKGAYTELITSGEGDYLTKDAVLELKVIKNKPNKNHTLQLLVYYLMGLRSIHDEFKEINYLEIFNPRLSTVYRYSVSNISKEIIKEVEKNVIGFMNY